jgi:hypothetical protein
MQPLLPPFPPVVAAKSGLNLHGSAAMSYETLPTLGPIPRGLEVQVETVMTAV